MTRIYSLGTATGMCYGNIEYTSLTAEQAWKLAKYQAKETGKTVYVFMGIDNENYLASYAISSDTSAIEHTEGNAEFANGDYYAQTWYYVEK